MDFRNQQEEFERQAAEQKQQEVPWRLFTHRHILNTYWNKLSFCYLNEGKFQSNISIKILTQSIIQAVRTNAHFLKSF